MKLLRAYTVTCLIFFLLSCAAVGAAPADKATALASDINLRHLNALRREIPTDSGLMPAWIVYCESAEKNRPAEPYTFIEATGEGLSCVDDVARAAIVYLRYWELTHDPQSLAYAKDCFKFLHYLQAPDGTFYNWLLVDGKRNETRGNSLPGLTWWSARAAWAYGEGCRILHKADPLFAAQLAHDFKSMRVMLAKQTEEKYGQYKDIAGIRAPAWLINDGSDITSLFVLALCDYESAYPSATNRTLIQRLCEAIVAVQAGDERQFPWKAHMPWTPDPSLWHGWGSHQVAALAVAGRLLKNKQFVTSAELAANNMTVHLLASDGPIYAFDPTPREFEQIHYAVEFMVYGYTALSEATSKTQYRELARFAASWMMGNNTAKAIMYDAKSGRGYDGINGTEIAAAVNYNAGAESTIEALLSLLLLAAEGISLEDVDYHRIGGKSYQVISTLEPQNVPKVAAGSYRIFAVLQRNPQKSPRAISGMLSLNGINLGVVQIPEGRKTYLATVPKVADFNGIPAHFTFEPAEPDGRRGGDPCVRHLPARPGIPGR